LRFERDHRPRLLVGGFSCPRRPSLNRCLSKTCAPSTRPGSSPFTHGARAARAAALSTSHERCTRIVPQAVSSARIPVFPNANPSPRWEKRARRSAQAALDIYE
jgi:hypothetical protein